MFNFTRLDLTVIVVVAQVWLGHAAFAADELPSWNDGSAKTAIVEFVEKVTREGGSEFVVPAERIAVFDNDGTLWSEQPMYDQLAFAIDRVNALVPEHPEWRQQDPFKSVLEGNAAGLASSGYDGVLELLMKTHAGNSTEEFAQIVSDWLAVARHPTFDRPYTELVYQPMIEVMDYLRDNGFKVFIVSAGGVEFMRPWTETVYGIPPEQVIGSSIKVAYEVKDGIPILARLPELNFANDGEAKPVAIHYHIGRRPIMAFGNSDGDLDMLEWTTSGNRPGLGVLLHHDDGEREFAYDRDTSFGKLDKGLDQAPERGWTLISMKNDWKRAFPFQ